jgi:hypothetical protein
MKSQTIVVQHDYNAFEKPVFPYLKLKRTKGEVLIQS